MDADFSKPQRQSAVGIIVMAANTLQHTIKALIAPLLVAIIKVDRDFLSYFGLIVLGVLILITLYAYFSYRRFTFYLDRERQEFVIHKGIFSRTQITVQLDKIQHVNINQNFLQRLIGIYGLVIDTAGTKNEEVSIKAIDERLANSLREHLLNNSINTEKHPTNANETLTQSESYLLKVSPVTLFKVGLTSNYGSSIALLLAFLYPLFHNVREIMNALEMDEGKVDHAIANVLTLFSLSILAIILLVLLLAINLIRTYVRYFNFTVRKYNYSLWITSGLFAKKNTLLSPKKVQITSYSQNYFQRKMNFFDMNLKQAAAGHDTEGKANQDTNLKVPGCSLPERDELLSLIHGKLPQAGKIFKPNIRFINLPILFRAILPVAIFLAFWLNFPELKSYYPIAIIYFILVTVMMYISYRRHQISVSQDFIIKRSGIWDIEHQIIVPHKIQAITTFQYPWHKSVDVGHVNLHTAAGIIHFKFGNYTEIKKLVNYWLYQIECGSEEWM
jgi:putative membrane protein